MRARIVLTLANDLAELSRLAMMLEKACEAFDVPARVIADLNVCLEEIAVNVIHYAWGVQPELRPDGTEDDSVLRPNMPRGADSDFLFRPGRREFTIEIRIDPERVEIESIDDGRPFDPLSLPEPNLSLPLEERPIGGLGVHLVRKLMTSVSYRRADGKNRFWMMRTISKEE